LNEKLSFLVIRSSPKNILAMDFLARATGTSDAALMPIRPSDSQSTANPLAKAIIIHAGVLIFNGMHRTIAGSTDSMMYGPRGE
jgi:hypothetical protein